MRKRAAYWLSDYVIAFLAQQLPFSTATPPTLDCFSPSLTLTLIVNGSGKGLIEPVVGSVGCETVKESSKWPLKCGSHRSLGCELNVHED